jgi:hypothetical protein
MVMQMFYGLFGWLWDNVVDLGWKMTRHTPFSKNCQMWVMTNK